MRQPEPFFRQQTQSWYVQIGKDQKPLGKDKKAAWQEYHKLMAGQRKLFSADPVAFVVDEFLEWVQNHNAPRTYDFYQRHLESFVGYIGKTLRVTELRTLNVTRWIAAKYPDCGDTTHNSAIGTVARAMNWAVEQGIIERSPIEGIKKPPRHQRETFITQDQYDQLLEVVKDQAFRDVLTTLWETGCRPRS